MSLPNPSMDFTPFDVLTAAELDDLVENDQALAAGTGLDDGAVKPVSLMAGTGTSWTFNNWTPTWTNLSVGNGTLIAKYIQTGKLVNFYLSLTFGTTTSVAGSIIFTLPVTSVAVSNTTFPLAKGSISNGPGAFNAFATHTTTTTLSVRYWDVNNNQVATSGTAPGTFGTGWIISLDGFYQAA